MRIYHDNNIDTSLLSFLNSVSAPGSTSAGEIVRQFLSIGYIAATKLGHDIDPKVERCVLSCSGVYETHRLCLLPLLKYPEQSSQYYLYDYIKSIHPTSRGDVLRAYVLHGFLTSINTVEISKITSDKVQEKATITASSQLDDCAIPRPTNNVKANKFKGLMI
jgi:hypothetical protein